MRKKRTKPRPDKRALAALHSTYPRGSDEANAIRVLHDMVGRTRAFFEIFRSRIDGSVSYTKEMTAQLLALAQAPQQSEWVTLTYRQAGAWESLLAKAFDQGLVRQRLQEGSKAPWPWPPSIEGKLYPDADGVPPITDEDRDAFANEGQR